MGDYFIDLAGENLEEGKELQAVAEGEYRVRIKDWKTDDDGKIVKRTDKDFPYIMPVLEIINCPEAEYSKDLTHFLWMPHDEMDAKQRNNCKFALHEFWTAFGIDYRQKIDPESVIGAEADALLIVSPDTGYGEQNKIKRFVTSR